MSNRRKISNSDVFNSIQRDSCDKALVQDLHLIFVFSAGIQQDFEARDWKAPQLEQDCMSASTAMGPPFWL